MCVILSHWVCGNLLQQQQDINTRMFCFVLSLTKLCLTLCDPMDSWLTGSSVHGILQARVPEWAATSFSRGASPPRGGAHDSCIGRWSLFHWEAWKHEHICLKMKTIRDFPGSRWLSPRNSRAGGIGSILVREVRSYVPCGQRKKENQSPIVHLLEWAHDFNICSSAVSWGPEMWEVICKS